MQCPCCDYFTLDERGYYDICPVCFWEDDGTNIDEPDTPSRQNRLTLRDARTNFTHFGAYDESAVHSVMPESSRGRFKRIIRQID
ncbi:MAG: hypothetical protein LBV45_07360 [Xanthomonadaceae bacterium]|nr:hypothetical protein [Xanthomonadaceae bacterium]